MNLFKENQEELLKQFETESDANFPTEEENQLAENEAPQVTTETHDKGEITDETE